MGEPRTCGYDSRLTPIEFAKKWYSVDDIHTFLKFHAGSSISGVPRDMASGEFAAWLHDQFLLSMAKGIEIGRRWDEYAGK